VIPHDKVEQSVSCVEGAKREERNKTFGMDRGFAMACEWAARAYSGFKRRRLGRNFDASVHNCLWRTAGGAGN